jgi:predicted aspartyl protease
VTTSRLFITDRVSKRQFVVDTGSDLCVFPRKFTSGRKERVNYDFFAANGTTIPTYGWLSLNLNLSLRRDFTWRFVVPDIQIPVIGVDLLTHFGLNVDCRNNRLLDRVTSLSIPAQAANSLMPSI